MNKEEILKKNKSKDKKDEYEVREKEKSGIVMVIAIFILSCLIGIVRIIRHENILDLCVIFPGAIAVQNFYMFSKCKKIMFYLIPAIIATIATVICFIGYCIKG
ncbi:DUF6442 family protein [Eubacterium multiforme]|uniref:Uncharacterized protein n=1 Tax=Eubacterium multiforme TaxID=83339 RepID=A0ABT9UTM8_9FIRM|nr:DUF6442 family protein [Eubacterium multiforme]MDQ0149651.1 hypothetical protein [Eubacterium multiforme]